MMMMMIARRIYLLISRPLGVNCLLVKTA